MVADERISNCCQVQLPIWIWEDLDQFIISCLFTKKRADSVLSHGFRKRGAVSMYKSLFEKDDEGSVYKWEGEGGGGDVYTSLFTTNRAHERCSEWIKNR